MSKGWDEDGKQKAFEKLYSDHLKSLRQELDHFISKGI